MNIAHQFMLMLKWRISSDGWRNTQNEDPVIVAAWFHHRFTQIHPYQDGNGRVARALTTLILLRADLLPLVVDRDLRVEYIKALELADQKQLSATRRNFRPARAKRYSSGSQR